MPTSGLEAHWDGRYQTIGADQVSWFAPEPTVARELLDELDVTTDATVVDVGGGASLLVDRLIDRGHTDITVVDISQQALDVSARRVGPGRTAWVRTDVLDWVPNRRFDLWHDRAVFHFLMEPSQRSRYVDLLRRSVEPGALVIIATFAPDGPEMCSGLPVRRYDAKGILDELGHGFELATHRREDHVTPAGAVQHFNWTVLRAIQD
jgi:SAM-dependent methyltransferase